MEMEEVMRITKVCLDTPRTKLAWKKEVAIATTEVKTLETPIKVINKSNQILCRYDTTVPNNSVGTTTLF